MTPKSVVINLMTLAFIQLPIMVLFSKITPENIEASCFALLTGTFNFSYHVIAPLVGTTINDWFVGVTSKDLSKLPTLAWIEFATQLCPFLFLWLIPLRQEI